MPLRMWTYDLAREQTPTLEHLVRLAELSLESGYNALGIYLEHRFAYPSTPWSHGLKGLTPDDAQHLIRRFPDLQIIPFVNLLGHCEGLIYTETGTPFAAERFSGMQADPANPTFVELADRLLQDVLDTFTSEIVHIGGDETWQLGVGAASEARVREYEAGGIADGKAELYGRHFGPLAQRVVDAGRRPAVWGDMFVDHPAALAHLPKETLIFDWQYFGSPLHTSRRFIDAGHEVVVCPTLHVYNAPWLHLPQSEQNIRDHVAAAPELGAAGVCVTTWEMALFGNYETILPAIRAAGTLLQAPPAAIETAGPGQIELDGPADLSPETMELIQSVVIVPSERWVLEPSRDALEIARRADGADRPFRRIAADRATGVTHELRALARLTVGRESTKESGIIRGTLDGVPFEITVHGEPTLHGVRLVLVPPRAASPAAGDYADLTEAPEMLRAYLRDSERHEEWARLMGVELPRAGGIFAYSGIRSALKCRFLLYSNPFLLWLRNREDILGAPGQTALEIADRAIAFAPDAATRGVSEFVKIAIQFVQYAEAAHVAYAAGRPGEATAALAPSRPAFDDLARIARGTQIRIGGSLADVERCTRAKEHVETVMRRIKQYGDGSLGYLPSFETLTHPKFIPHDQGNWWLINRHANE